MTAADLSGSDLERWRNVLRSYTTVFGDPEDFETALTGERDVTFLLNGHGRFQARVTQLLLHGLSSTAGKEELARIAFVAVPPGMVLVLLGIGPKTGAYVRRYRDRGVHYHSRSWAAGAREDCRALSLGLISYRRATLSRNQRPTSSKSATPVRNMRSLVSGNWSTSLGGLRLGGWPAGRRATGADAPRVLRASLVRYPSPRC